MKHMILTATLIALAGCDRQDGYSFDRKEFERSQPAITVVTHPSLADLRAAAPPSAIEPGRELMGWSVIRPGGCEMHVVDPAKRWMPEWLGHEAAHCIWGRWHQ